MPPLLTMLLTAHLVHAESGRRVVEVRACEGERLLGSALGEAADAEMAEDRARERLLKRLQPSVAPEVALHGRHSEAADKNCTDSAVVSVESRQRQLIRFPLGSTKEDDIQASAPNQASDRQPRVDSTDPGGPDPGTDPPTTGSSAARIDDPARESPDRIQEPIPDPEDWSSDLAALDLQLRRLGWEREREATYLQRAFGHPSRNRLTNYSDLRAYLHALERMPAGSEPASVPVPLRRSELLSQCDALLAQLGWNADMGRSFLERELQAESRQQLNDQQLLHFNMLLESELLAAGLNQAPVVP
ncbi:MAG: hypothetical protein NTY67_07455 [Cyanobacteria bacterium]|nr:hypothetical protein [Cyanobacteriota bacterium]